MRVVAAAWGGLAVGDELLRGAGRFSVRRFADQSPATLVRIIVAGAAVYGAAMGSAWLSTPERCWQVLFAGLKAPLLLLVTTGLCLPAFFVVNTVAGLRADLGMAVRAILAGQAALSLALASLAPLTLFWYASVDSYRAALLFNAAMFTLATGAGQIVIRRYYGDLIRRDARHRWMAAAWFALYAFVGIQMGWVLRPFIGDPTRPVGFFRDEPFSNAYVVVFRLICG